MKLSSNSVLVTPGLAAAVAQEGLVRDAAFLGVTENVGGFELRPMTLRHYLTLRVASCRLLAADRAAEGVTDVELATFLWVLSPGFRPGEGWRKRRFLARCRREFGEPGLPVLPTVRALRRWARRRGEARERREALAEAARGFMAETLQDRPGRSSGGGYVPSYYSEACFWWGTLGRAGYVMGLEQVLDLPVKILFQCVREVIESKGGAVANASDGLKQEHLRRLNEELLSRSMPAPAGGAN